MSQSALKSEIYIINLLKASNEAREFVAGYLDSWTSSQREMLLTWLPKQAQLQTLADKLRCPKDEVFEVLVSQLHKTFQRKPLRPFSFEHLHKLAKEQNQHHVARIIGCDPRDVLNKLFNVNAILEVLFEFHPDWVRQQYAKILTGDRGQDASFILLKLLATKVQIKTRHHVDDLHWGDFFDTRHIITNYALGKLQDYAMKQGFAPEASSRLLAVALDTDSTSGGRGVMSMSDDIFLDAFGVLEIKRRVEWIVSQLRESVQYTTRNENEDTVVDTSSIQAYLEFHELGEPAVVWRKVLESDLNLPSIRDKLIGLDFQSTKKSGTPKANAHLRVHTEEVLSQPPRILFWKKARVIDNLLIVSCEIKEEPLPVDILIGSQISSAQASELATLFTPLLGKAVATDYVSDLGKQVLEKQLVFPGDLKAVIKATCNQFLVEFIRGLILTGVTVPYDIDRIWKNRLNSSLPITPITYETENLLPVTRAELVERIHQKYLTYGNVTIVS